MLIFSTSADCFQAEVIPSEVSIGDAFLLKVCKNDSKEIQADFNKIPLYFSKYGDCSIAIGAVALDTKIGSHRVRVIRGGRKLYLRLKVKKTQFPTTRLTLPSERVFLSPSDIERVQQEQERLSLIWKEVSERQWEKGFVIPLKNDISTFFGTKRLINKKKLSIHKGVDIKGSVGEPVKASNKGKVIMTDELFFGGNTVIIDHGLGIYSIYMHLERFNVKLADVVSKEDVIGFVGETGRTLGAHLHFGMVVSGISINPISLINLGL